MLRPTNGWLFPDGAFIDCGSKTHMEMAEQMDLSYGELTNDGVLRIGFVGYEYMVDGKTINGRQFRHIKEKAIERRMSVCFDLESYNADYVTFTYEELDNIPDVEIFRIAIKRGGSYV